MQHLECVSVVARNPPDRAVGHAIERQAHEGIKPTDPANVGIHHGDRDGIAEVNAALVREILER
jgi:hypothetical protein